MARADKAGAVADITEAFQTASAAVLTEYRGLSVAQLKKLRRNLGDGSSYAVVKNTLAKIGAKNAGVEGIDDMLQGPSAIAFVKGDPVEAAKTIRDFAKENPLLVIKGGLMDGKVLSAQEIGKLADLESREVLLAKLAGAMNASLTKAAYLFNAPLAQAARVLGALRDAATANPSIIGGAGTPAPAAATTETTVDEAAPAAEETVTETAPAVEADSSETAPAVEADSSETASAVEADAPEAAAAEDVTTEAAESSAEETTEG
jgi:large subunit ribosomal protein L10